MGLHTEFFGVAVSQPVHAEVSPLQVWPLTAPHLLGAGPHTPITDPVIPKQTRSSWQTEKAPNV